MAQEPALPAAAPSETPLHVLQYVTPSRTLERFELMRIHRELEYVQRFTARYAVLFDESSFAGDQVLEHLHDNVCNILVAMQAGGPREHAECDAAQLQYVTTAHVAKYITAVALFSDKSMRSLVNKHEYARAFPHWEHDNYVLSLMKRGVQALLQATTPILHGTAYQDAGGGATAPAA